MYAVVTDRVFTTDGRVLVDVGARIEVLGFAHYGGDTRAVYRDDEGALFDIPVGSIRMEPFVTPIDEATRAQLRNVVNQVRA